MIKKIILSALIIILALFGGMQFYLQHGILWFGVAAGWVTMGWAAWLVVTHRSSIIPFWPSLKWLYVAVIISVLANLDIYRTTLGRLWLYTLAMAVLVISHMYLSKRQIYAGIYRAGWIWPWVWLALYLVGLIWPVWLGNHNIFAFWSIVFIAVGLRGHSWLYILPHLVMLVFFGSRGAIIGVGAVLLVYLWPVLRRSRYVLAMIAPFVVAVVVWLISWRPATAAIRLHYWQSAWAAFVANPIFGVGPGGLKIGKFITEPGLGYQVHSHNALVTWTAETGLHGLVCLAMALNELRYISYTIDTWQLAILTGLFVHSMVDEPLFWPGPLLAFALVVGTTYEQNT